VSRYCPDCGGRLVVETDAGAMLRVYHGKSDQFRETPMPRDLQTTISTVTDVRGEDDSTPLIDN
jgi:hypothetical protein